MCKSISQSTSFREKSPDDSTSVSASQCTINHTDTLKGRCVADDATVYRLAASMFELSLKCLSVARDSGDANVGMVGESMIEDSRDMVCCHLRTVSGFEDDDDEEGTEENCSMGSCTLA